MKNLTSWEKHELEHSHMFVIRRPDGWAAIDPSEVPTPGERLEIDGKEVVVDRADATVASYNFRPHIVIIVAKTS